MPKVGGIGQATILEPSTAKAILAEMKGELRMIFLIGLHTAARWGEIVQLKRLDCYDDKGCPRAYITFGSDIQKQSAGHKPQTRQIPTRLSLQSELKDYQGNGMISEWMFPAKDPSQHLTAKAASMRFKRFLKSQGLGDMGISTHSTRRTFATLMQHELSPKELMQLTGHKSLSSLQRYLEVDPRKIEKVMIKTDFS
mgnify:CR=1 FL=1